MADTYKVKKGDTLSEIASKYYKTYNYASWKAYQDQLVKLNDISNPNLIYVGQVLKLNGSPSSSSSSSNEPSTVTITQFGLQSNTDNTLFVIWKFSRSNTENYQVKWEYQTEDGNWFNGSDSTVTEKQSLYNYPTNAEVVRVKIKPISKTYTQNNKTVSYWTGSWSSVKNYDIGLNAAIPVPNVPTLERSRYYDNKGDIAFYATASIAGYSIEPAETKANQAVRIRFEFYITSPSKNQTELETDDLRLTKASVQIQNLEDDKTYKVRCRAEIYDKNTDKTVRNSEWTDYSHEIKTASRTPDGFKSTDVKHTSDNKFDVYLEWNNTPTADSYNVEYTTNVDYFGSGGNTQTMSNIEHPNCIIAGLEGGLTYHFRVQSENEGGVSGWTRHISLILGQKPSIPTTWSSTMSAVYGEEVTLYWLHNSTDGSKQKYAQVELIIDNAEPIVKTIDGVNENDEPINYYAINTNDYTEGASIRWRVRTAGILRDEDDLPVYGDWSIYRQVDIYAKPTIAMGVTNQNGEIIETLTTFPFKVSAESGPDNQTPIMYNLSVIANSSYETIDSAGNSINILEGQPVYSVHFDPTSGLFDDPYNLEVELSAGNIDLENGISYTIFCTVTMNSGLTGTGTHDILVDWEEKSYKPNAEIGIDNDVYTAIIRPYCEEIPYYKVDYFSDKGYVRSEETIPPTEGEMLQSVVTNANGEILSYKDILTTTGEPVYGYEDASGNDLYFCIGTEPVLTKGVLLSVYRRDFDGSFTEIARDLENSDTTYVTDPHPALDYARYRIVAKTTETGSISYYDIPDYPVGGSAIIIQWDETWKQFETANGDEPAESSWSGSMVKLPYNIDTSDSYKKDVSFVNYIGRKRPVSYHGTHLDETSSWSTEIPATDTVTLNTLRRLAIWTGDVYVREPSGTGYWANIKISISQTHCEVTIPVSIEITRVEGGV